MSEYAWATAHQYIAEFSLNLQMSAPAGHYLQAWTDKLSVAVG